MDVPDASDPAAEPRISDLFRSLIDDTRRLMRDEIELAKAEMADKARHVLRQSMYIAVGVVLAIAALFAAIGAITLGLAHAFTPLAGREAALWLAPLLMAVLCGAGGAALLMLGIRRLKAKSLAPEKTLEALDQTGRLVADRFRRT